MATNPPAGRHLRLGAVLLLAAAVALGTASCSGSRSLPDDERSLADSAEMDPEAVEACLADTADSPVSHLDAAWNSTVEHAVEAAEQFDPSNTAPRQALSMVDPTTSVAFCVFSGSMWSELTPSSDGRVLYYVNTAAPMKDSEPLTTTVNGVIGYF